MIRFCCLEYNDEVISDTVSMKLIELNIDPNLDVNLNKLNVSRNSEAHQPVGCPL